MNDPFDPVYLWTIPLIQFVYERSSRSSLKMMNIPIDPVYLFTIP